MFALQTAITSVDLLQYWPILGGLVTLVAMSAVQLWTLQNLGVWVKGHRHDKDGAVYLPGDAR